MLDLCFDILIGLIKVLNTIRCSHNIYNIFSIYNISFNKISFVQVVFVRLRDMTYLGYQKLLQMSQSLGLSNVFPPLTE